MARRPAFKALVVDDAEDVRLLVQRALKRVNMECDVAKDGNAAENMARLHTYDLVLSDLRMPKKHGHQLIANLLKENYPAMLIVLTGVCDPRMVTDLIARGVTDVIQKPIDYDLLAAKVKALLKRGKYSPADPTEATSATTISEHIATVSSVLKDQLAEVTESFDRTIAGLEKQQDQLESGYLGSVRILTNLMNQFEQSEGSHASRVEEMSVALAQKENLDQQALLNLKIAALLHDIGQFGMPDAIRVKAPWSLEPNDWAAYLKYPLIGAALLSEISGAEDVVELVETHAEYFDGNGFPNRVQGKEIPVAARIIRIADGSDTYLMHCTEKDKLKAVKLHLRQQRGKIYDPNLVNSAIEYLERRDEERVLESTVEVLGRDLRSGNMLAENVYDDGGRFLARAGASLTESMVPRLQKLLRNQNIKIYAE